MGSEYVPDAADTAIDLAALMIRTALTVAEDVLDAALDVESMLTGVVRENQRDEPPAPDDGGRTGSTPPNLELPDVSPGAETSGDFVVRNSGLDTVDAMRLRSSGLFAIGGLHISGLRVKFDPEEVEVAPHGTAVVSCIVHVPRDAKRGQYVGLIEATDRPDVKLLVELDVV
jgi:hypothetical protein